MDVECGLPKPPIVTLFASVIFYDLNFCYRMPNKFTQTLLLVIWIALIGGGLLMRVFETGQAGSREFVSGSLIKVGIVMALAWVAMPQLERLGWHKLRWTGVAIIVAIAAITAVRPRFGAIAAGIAIGGALVLAVLGWARGIIFNAPTTAVTEEKHGKIEKNPTKR